MKTIKIILIILTLSSQIRAQETPKPAITPYWGFGHWIWEDQLHTSNTVRYLIDGYSRYNIPVDAVILDSPWSSAYNNFESDTALYPDFENMLNHLHSKNIKLILWYTGFVNKESREVPLNQSPLYEPAVNMGYTVNNGSLHSWHKGKGAHIDFTNPEAKAWWHKQVDKILKQGIDGWKVDVSAEWLDENVSTSIGNLSNKEFKYYHYQDAFEYARSINPDFLCYTYGHVHVRNRYLDMAPQNYSHCQWTGDFTGDFKGLLNQLNFIYLSAQKGYGAPACEIGGYWGKPSDNKSFIRYAQLASMVPAMVNGGRDGALGHHLPWNYSEKTITIYRDYVNLHRKLVPYLFSTSVEGHLKGHSIIKECSNENNTHMLGDAIFVKPITTENDTVSIVFPDEHQWINYWDSKEVFSSSDTITKYYPIEKYPVFMRAGSIIPVANSDKNSIELLIYPDGKSEYVFHKPSGQGVDYTDIRVTMNAIKGTLEINSPDAYNFQLKLMCFDDPKSVSGADRYQYNPESSELLLEKNGSNFKIKIKGLAAY
ncbi:TIM-barrel domain-containing protein [Saccharicrinis sp. FJH62]|uniref:TIM-barrel domain-containing protein n=1 Tax=Saccharicrinis sp. FJH62 TaxID=3344657 RepID=UPI0035D42EE9